MRGILAQKNGETGGIQEEIQATRKQIDDKEKECENLARENGKGWEEVSALKR